MTNSPGNRRGVPPGPITRLALVFAIGLSLSLAALALWPAGTAAQPAEGPPPPVVVAPVTSENVARTSDFIGNVQAIQSVDLRARVTGFLEAVKFKEGAFVKQGDLLYDIEEAPYEAALAAAQGQLAAAQASLAGAKAKLTNAQADLDRQQTLVKRGTVSQAVADQAQATRDEAAAQVQSAEAAIKQAEAQIASAKLDLSYTVIKAPISGRIGATTTTVGNLVGPDSGALATIVQLDPIRVAFSVPDSVYVNFAQQHGGQSTEDINKFVEPVLTLPNGKTYNEDGDIAFINNQISQSTGTLVIYADFPNPKAQLLPGAFVSVNVSESNKQEMPVVPASAILQDRQGRYVFILGKDNRAEQRQIETTVRVDDGYAVSKGLQAGETVIVQGIQKVRPGEQVTPTRASGPGAGGGAEATTPTASPATDGSGGAAGSATPASAGAGSGEAEAAPAGSSGGTSPDGAAGSGKSPPAGSGAAEAAPAGSSGGTGPDAAATASAGN